MIKHFDITLGRVRIFTDQFKARCYGEELALKPRMFAAPGRIPYERAVKGTYKACAEGVRLGPLWSTYWFRVETAIPSAWKGREVLLHFSTNSEGLIWKDGVPVQGITSDDWGPGSVRAHYRLTRRARGGEKETVYIEAACNRMGGTGMQLEELATPREYRLDRCRLVCFDRKAWDLWVRLDLLARFGEKWPATDIKRQEAIFVANEMVNACNPEDRSTWDKALALSDRFFSRRNSEDAFAVSAVGISHLDTAWLWPVSECIRKAARTFSSALRMIEDYPEYKFACSQALHLQWMRDYYPPLYKQIKQRVKDGRFVLIGGAWVEPDCNVPSGESFVRQFLFGQRFFQREFGVTCREFWQPDVFGYSAALPQIMKLCGMDYFMTVKLNGNPNPIPTASFRWEGIDGTQVFAHFPPVGISTTCLDPIELHGSMHGFKDRERGSDSLLAFGYGDGGGGPTEVMMDRYELLKDLEGMPRTRIRTPQEFFERAEKNTRDPMVWRGELYYEDHRGTLTTHAAIKRDNRRCEELLHDVELLASLAGVVHGEKYPAREIEALWELVLLNQFHDIIPGSSITEVYEQAWRDYADVIKRGAALKEKSLKALAPSAAGPHGLLVVNTLPFERREVVQTPQGPVVVEAPATGYAVVGRTSDAGGAVTVSASARGFTLKNTRISATFDAAGGLLSLVDRATGREAIEPGRTGNRFILFDDNPNYCDAWNVDVFHLEKFKTIEPRAKARIVSNDGLTAAIEVEYALTGKSRMRQVISLNAESARLDFACEVDWHESHQLLKVEFPLDIRCDYATYEIQFGHVRRPTHFNTSWDAARFEVCGHRWADLSDAAFGVAVLNDSKYGYSCLGNVMRLSLLRAPKCPDPDADMGKHAFRYALLPHAGPPQTAGVVQAAAAFNQPLVVQPSRAQAERVSFFNVSNPAIMLDTVKKAEDSEDLILRFYESTGCRQNGRLTSSLSVGSAARVDLLERQIQKETWSGGLDLSLHPFEIVTYRLGVK